MSLLLLFDIATVTATYPTPPLFLDQNPIDITFEDMKPDEIYLDGEDNSVNL